MSLLSDPVTIGGRLAPSRVMFGPHVTNLGRGRRMSERHVAYYRERAEGGAGVVVTETASVHPSDWPYERAPLAEQCRPGWAAVADACHVHGTLVLAGLGHTGAQGSSAYSQSVLWAPSPVADVVSREMPAAMEGADIDALIDAFAVAASSAMAASLDGVEIDAGATSLLRQFHSGLTNHRHDAYGTDRLRVTTAVLAAVRTAVGADGVVALRLSCDELAPWAGVTPEQAAEQVAVLAELVDALVVVRGGPYSAWAYRPDAHTQAGFNTELCARMRQAASGRTAVVLQGSMVDPADAQAALDCEVADLVEMTRAQIADPRLVGLVRHDQVARLRPCILCNQSCQVRDNRNPLVSCVGEPRSGHETVEPDPAGTDETGRDVLIVGAGVAGLECARVLAARGHRVRVRERCNRAGGVVAVAAVGPGRQRLAGLAAWLVRECAALGAVVDTGTEVTVDELDAARAAGVEVVLATGSRGRPPGVPMDGSCAVVDPVALLAAGADSLDDGPVLVHDPVGGPIGVGVAEWLAGAGLTVALVTPDQIVGTLLSLTGDLAEANSRLQRAGVHRYLRSLFRGTKDGHALLEDRWTGEEQAVPCASIIDCGPRLPEDFLYRGRPGTLRAGDCVAPRGILEAMLEGRRMALAVGGGRTTVGAGTPVGAGR